jgi:hypothetical protein
MTRKSNSDSFIAKANMAFEAACRKVIDRALFGVNYKYTLATIKIPSFA